MIEPPDGLKTLTPDEPVPLAKAVALGKHGGDRRSVDAVDQGGIATLKAGEKNTARLIVADVETLAMFDAEVARPHGGDRRGKKDNIQLEPSPSGTSKQAGVRRLRRERPDLLEEVKAGSKSVHAACVEAGFRKRLTGLEAAQADFQVAA